jgi:hypothetical protein
MVARMDLAILPGEGVGPILFGSDRDATAEAFGPPDREEELEDSMGERCIVWHYTALGMSLYFDEDADYRLGLVDVTSKKASILGVRPVGLGLAEAQIAFETFGGLALDEEFADLGRSAYDLQSEFVTIWFQDGVCDSIQAFVPIDADDEYLWPS